MRPGKYDMNLYRGDSYAWRFTLFTDRVGGTPADLTGVTAKAEIRDKTGGTVQATLTCTITQPNIILVKLPATAWTAFATAACLWDLQLTYSDGSVVTIVAGKVAVTGDVTDSVALPGLTVASRREVAA